MIRSHTRSCQPPRTAWSMDELIPACAEALANALDVSLSQLLQDLTMVATALNASLSHDDNLFLALSCSPASMVFCALARSWCGQIAKSYKISARCPSEHPSILLAPHINIRCPPTKLTRFIMETPSSLRIPRIQRTYVQNLQLTFVPQLAFPLTAQNYGCEKTALFLPDPGSFANCVSFFFHPTWQGTPCQAGGATTLAEDGAAPLIIQAQGGWKSSAWEAYYSRTSGDTMVQVT